MKLQTSLMVDNTRILNKMSYHSSNIDVCCECKISKIPIGCQLQINDSILTSVMDISIYYLTINRLALRWDTFHLKINIGYVTDVYTTPQKVRAMYFWRYLA